MVKKCLKSGSGTKNYFKLNFVKTWLFALAHVNFAIIERDSLLQRYLIRMLLIFWKKNKKSLVRSMCALLGPWIQHWALLATVRNVSCYMR